LAKLFKLTEEAISFST